MKDYNQSLKKHQIITKKSLLPPTITTASDQSPVSEVSDGVLSSESININTSLNPTLSVSLETCDLSDITSASKSSLEAEVVVDNPKQALVQILNSAEPDVLTKKLQDALTKIIVEEVKGLPDEIDMLSERIASKNRILLLGFLLLILCMTVVVFKNAGATTSFSGPLPT